MHRQTALLIFALLGANLATGGAPTAADSPCRLVSQPADAANQTAPPPSQSGAFPNYALQASTSRRLPLPPAQAAAVLLDFEHQCSTCTYHLGNIVAQEIFERDFNPHQFLVWRSVNKTFNLGFKKLPIRSSGFVEVRVFESSDKQHIVIDSRSLSDSCAAQKALLYSKPSDPAFDLFHTRWTLTALDPTQQDGMQVEIVGTAAGVPRGIAAKAPKSMLSWELKNAMKESLDFIAP